MRRALAAFVATAAALAAVGCSSSHSPEGSAPSSSESSLAAAPPTSTTVAAAEADDTTAASVVPGTSSTAPSTVVPTGTAEDLVALLPTADHLPEGWVVEPGEPTIEFEASSGFFRGTCSGPNADARAVDDGAWGVANSPGYRSPQDAWGYVTVYGFPSAEHAERFMERTRVASTCSQTGEVIEGSDPGEYDGFADPALDGTVRWAVTETTQAEPEAVTGADESFVVTTDDTVTSTHDKIDYSARLRDLTVVARFGDIVLVASLGSYCCDTGYAQSAGTAAVSLADIRPAVTLVAARVRTVMAARGLA